VFKTKGIIVAWVLAGVLAVITLVLLVLGFDQADAIAGSPDETIEGPYPWIDGLPAIALILTGVAILWAVAAMIIGAFRTRDRERSSAPGR